MCSRFELNSTPREIAEAFDLAFPPALPNQSEVRPTDQILAILKSREPTLLKWGIPAPWDGSPIFNARSETVTQKPTFRDYLSGRCLIPASAWFEWRKDGKAKIKTRIAPANSGQIPFAFTGLCNDSHATILTASAIPSLAEIHGRMPIVLTRDEAHQWLTEDKPLDDFNNILTPHDVGGFQGEPVVAPPEPKQASAQGDLFG